MNPDQESGIGCSGGEIDTPKIDTLGQGRLQFALKAGDPRDRVKIMMMTQARYNRGAKLRPTD